ncbi:hypothetical protein B9Z55_008167 [Caenorhabditis nigoni]|uniref:Uncharacterized protein n=1 Tax=Caenorhabditis nigoni TaxID=1611254 RepID=A0A2G5VCZ9_9PELO|nr:hypothetical protein B9Z55_008167 [Caenorhabditis nigoni]
MVVTLSSSVVAEADCLHPPPPTDLSISTEMSTSSLKLLVFSLVVLAVQGVHHHHEKAGTSTDSTVAKKLDFANQIMLASEDDSSSEESDATAPIVLNIFADGKKAHRANRRECNVQLALTTLSLCGDHPPSISSRCAAHLSAPPSK